MGLWDYLLHMTDKITDKWFRKLNERPEMDLRIYKVRLRCFISSDAPTDGQIENLIRGIEAVTTVKNLVQFQNKSANRTTRVYEIKFELEGVRPRETYVELTLIPEIKKIKGVSVSNIRGKIEQVQGKNLKEYWAGPAWSAKPEKNIQTMPHTPALTIGSVLQDWMEGAVQAYDTPMNTQNMAYHVMVPVEELWDLCNRYYRSGEYDFDTRYQDFIKNGPMQPVFVAVGRNGRVKLTGNEDAVWFAKKSGLKELPVFFSYQRQV